jgi:pimeloyl-ACP methyl ester carboxylesterase
VIHNLGPKLAKHFVSGEESEDSRRKAIERMQRYDIKAGIRQVRQIFWKENVSKLWGTLDKPVLILVSPNDPVTPRDDSAKVFDLLRYPIWMELEVPDHMLLEDNVEFLSEFIPRFTRDPWGVYEENKHLRP